MPFVIFDLEFNQDFPSLQSAKRKSAQNPFEIIQIGAVKLDDKLNTLETFNRYVRPVLYTRVNPFITELTGISTQQLQAEALFPEVCQAFFKFIENTDTEFCIWGMDDIKVLFRNINYHQLDNKCVPRKYINLQSYVPIFLELPEKKLLRLRHAAEQLNIPILYPFHNALYDAYYTAEIFKKIYHPTVLKSSIYDPSYIKPRKRQRRPRTEIDAAKLIEQFEKMYVRKMTKEEQEIIMLAYKMGRTNQFILTSAAPETISLEKKIK